MTFKTSISDWITGAEIHLRDKILRMARKQLPVFFFVIIFGVVSVSYEKMLQIMVCLKHCPISCCLWQKLYYYYSKETEKIWDYSNIPFKFANPTFQYHLDTKIHSTFTIADFQYCIVDHV